MKSKPFLTSTWLGSNCADKNNSSQHLKAQIHHIIFHAARFTLADLRKQFSEEQKTLLKVFPQQKKKIPAVFNLENI